MHIGNKFFKKTFFFCCYFSLFINITFSFWKNSFAGSYENHFTSAIVANKTKDTILYSYNADDIVYPASLTKMMTAYVVFDSIRNGLIGLHDNVSIAKYKDYGICNIFTCKNPITIKDLILKMSVLSSNIACDILATEISGRVENFVVLMNKYAKDFGLQKTHFSNTHGLFDEKHVSTARELLQISMNLVNDFPSYIQLFGITYYVDNDESFNKKTSTVQSSIKGIQGGKTGFISASGFNLSIWGEYEKEQVFAIVIGATNKISRDALILKLLNKSIKSEITAKSQPDDKDYKIMFKVLKFFNLDPYKYLSQVPVERNGFNNKSSYYIANDNEGGDEELEEEQDDNNNEKNIIEDKNKNNIEESRFYYKSK